MSTTLRTERLTVPHSLRDQLTAFRKRVWSTKMLEACALALAGLLIAFLLVYVTDRLIDTPRSMRLTLWLGALGLGLAIPWAFHRWVWRHRRLDQLARLLRVREPDIGDQLLSVIELAENETEQARSRTLCAAAIQQVATAAKHRDLNEAAPVTWVRLWCTAAVATAAIALIAVALTPAAAWNAWSRMIAPWNDTPRYTFTRIEAMPERMVVPHGESMPLKVSLAEKSRWNPKFATLQVGDAQIAQASNHDGAYHFEIPALTSQTVAHLKVGDYIQNVLIEPKLRPELIGASAKVQLPDYLGLPEPVEKDVRSGTLVAVEGSRAVVTAKASRELRTASINDDEVLVKADSFRSGEVALMSDSRSLKMNWQDHDGLSGREPFKLAVKPSVDEAPSVTTQDLPRQPQVIIQSEQLNFTILAADDFGLKAVGMEWHGLDERGAIKPAHGEKIIAAGSPQQSSIQAPATFSAEALGIEAQPIELRMWTEDYLPGRKRVYSSSHILYVLTPDEHAVWITSQLSKWHKAALDVRDREMSLHETNKRLRSMTSDELSSEDMQKELRSQANAEASNGRQLSNLSRAGENLIRQAARNPEIGVGHLERWAEMLQILGDISANRMPSVSDLLSKASTQVAQKPGNSPPMAHAPSAGPNRKDTASGNGTTKPREKLAENQEQPMIPKVGDAESSLQPPMQMEGDETLAKKHNGSKQGLVVTTINGPSKKTGNPPPEEKDEESSLDQAVYEQADLLAEFDRIADELNTVLANLEGSTLVKRLKAASREQSQVAQRIGSRINMLFGRSRAVEHDDQKMLTDLSSVELKNHRLVSNIMDDMQSYFERRRLNQFKIILDEMRQSEILGALTSLSEEIPKEHGLSIAQAEYWADTLDRWADDLVDPACSGSCPGSKTSDSLPPSIILEVLKILEGEVNLREDTRVTEQARPAVQVEQHATEAKRLSQVQFELTERVDTVVRKIEEMPDGAQRFPKDINQLMAVSRVMSEATQILAGNDTGTLAIAAETEAIELLLQIKRINPNGGGGGGTSPGGGGIGTTVDSALALIGTGINQNERRQPKDVNQAVGESSRVLPEEFRAGLDEYFNRLENGR